MLGFIFPMKKSMILFSKGFLLVMMILVNVPIGIRDIPYLKALMGVH